VSPFLVRASVVWVCCLAVAPHSVLAQNAPVLPALLMATDPLAQCPLPVPLAADATRAVEVALQQLAVASIPARNQLAYLCLQQVPRGPQAPDIVIGPGDWLFERAYVFHALTPAAKDTRKLRAAIAHARSVQAKLARRKIPFLLVIAPTKVEVFPEYVPPALFAGKDIAAVTTEFERGRALIKKARIAVYDGPARFQAWKAAGDQDLFARSGTHWSHHGAWRVLLDLRERLNKQLLQKDLS